jgi:FlaA1/EpsC-like NDP-sugar epimerase
MVYIVITNFINIVLKLNRTSKIIIMMSVDSLLAIFVLVSSYSLRFDSWFWPKDEFFIVVFGSPLILIPIFYSFKLYSSITRFFESDALLLIAQAVTLYAFTWGLIGYLTGVGTSGLQPFPRSVILINWLLSIVIFIFSRVYARWLFSANKLNNKNVIIYGAGAAGLQLSNTLKASDKYTNIAYVDNSKVLHGSYINSIKVHPTSEIELLIKKYNVNDLFLALPSISFKQRNEIIEKLLVHNIHVRSLPRFSDIAEGKLQIEDLKEININDLLGRDLVKPNVNLLKVKIKNKVVLVTGAGGSIGSELSRQIFYLKPKKLILFDVSESALYHIDQELSNLDEPNIEITPVIGSVRDAKRMKNIFKNYGVQTIYHAAAYKHVPLVEHNQSQGVLNNSIGTMFAAESAIDANVETFVLISTDKAVRPTNTMGASKRVAELVLQALANQNHNTSLTMVRFGNVLDSSGSVIPLFKKQIKQGGPVTVTQSNIFRYFMTIPEAVELVIQAGAMGEGGEVFVLDMGKPVRIFDLAKKMIQLSGLQLLDKNNPEGDIEIIFTGLRPGEKLYEELLVGNNVTKTENKLIMRAEEEMIPWEKLKPLLDDLNQASINFEEGRVRELLIEIVPEFIPTFPIIDKRP